MPKIRATLDPAYRKTRIETFVQHAIGNHAIDPQEFWETRDIVGRGSITADSAGLSLYEKTNALSMVDAQMLDSKDIFVFFSYTSPMWYSVEGLVPAKNANEITQTYVDNMLASGDVVLNTERDIIVKTDAGYTILFLKPIDQMQKTNGFLDYNGAQKELVKDKVWVSISRITGKF